MNQVKEDMEFTKLQATGNDFIVIDAIDRQLDWPSISRKMCDRHFGVGADGLIIVKKSPNADFSMSIFNADGSEAEICGNGLRCFAKYVLDNKLTAGSTITVSTLADIRTVETSKENGQVTYAKVNMGSPKFAAEDIPVILTSNDVVVSNNTTIPIIDYKLKLPDTVLSISLVSMGNPHAVALINEDIASFKLSDIGPQVENNGIFPERINFEVARIISNEKIEARVWERGVGETLACGSGACAIAVAAQLKNLTDNKVDIMLPGGILTVSWDRAGEVFLSGSVEEVFTGRWKE